MPTKFFNEFKSALAKQGISMQDVLGSAARKWMEEEESTEMARKQVKISSELHKEIDIESATRDIPHYALMEEAWGYYRQARAGLQDPTDRQQAVGSGTKAPNDQSPATQEMLDKIKELADQFAKLQNTIERDRAERARTAPARSKRARKA